ncbi:MAG TPA: alkaline phosphatase family protein [Candidatus Xenobia bacterium]|nr:alkaline phosphatase family protein [Candidatus Xenobia bacterium]
MTRPRFLLAVALVLLLAAALGARAAEPAPPPPTDSPPPRLIVIKVDGLSPLLVDALMDPDDPERVERLPDPEGFRRAVAMFRLQTGNRDLLPNLRRCFYEQGVVAENMYSATTTLSSIAWSVIETGQPSVIKRHMYFNRNNGQLRGYLDAFRDTWDIAWRRGRKTTAVWELDQTGVSLFADAFQPLRRYDTPQMYYRLTPASYLGGMATAYLSAGGTNPWSIARRHMTRRVEGMDYPDFAEEFVADHIAEKVLEPDAAHGERYDYISTFFSLDHQHHVDPTPENLVHRMIRLDRRLGRILSAVEKSRRRDSTLVAVVSDHGSEYEPGVINQAWPITRAFRTRLFGGHTVATVMAEDAGRALTTPVPGVDYPRIYESPFSPYGPQAGGEEGYSTAFIDNFGNARAEVHLRNNELNRLHLLLLARQQRRLSEAQRARLNDMLRATLADLWQWLEPELKGYEDYYLGVRAWLPNLKARTDFYWRDAAFRLEEEQKLDAEQLRALRRLAELCRAPDPLAWLEKNKPAIPDLIPKRYFGRRNSVYQLTHFTLGLDENLNWVETTVNLRGQPAPMDYISIFSDYRLPNPPVGQEPNPVDLIVRTLPVEPVRAALVARGWLEPQAELRQVVWIVSTAQHSLRRGDQALLLEAANGDLRYVPIRRLAQRADGGFELEAANELDPLGLLHDPGFASSDGTPAFWWLDQFHSPREWLRAVHNTHYTVAPLIFDDIAGFHAEPFVANPQFQEVLAGFPSEADRQRYLNGLRWKYRSQQPDLLLWSNHLWNFSSKSQTSGGSHGGLIEEVTRTTFLLWGGRNFGLPAGARVSEPATTMDIAPTLAELMGMLDPQNRVVRQPGAIRERPFLPFAGRPLLEMPAGATIARAKANANGAR